MKLKTTHIFVIFTMSGVALFSIELIASKG